MDSLHINLDSLDLEDVGKIISNLNIDRSVKRVTDFHGGTHEVKKHLEDFLKNKLDKYLEIRNNPTQDCLPNTSPYLHFGQISPLYIALQVLAKDSPGKDAYLEELIVRRELSVNFVFYNQEYDSFYGLPR